MCPTHQLAEQLIRTNLITCILIEFCDPESHEPNGLQLCDRTVCTEADATESY